jgi:hypothetical protein
LTLADGTMVEGVWAGSAMIEKIKWWLAKPEHEIAQTDEVSEIAIKGETKKLLQWGDAPAGSRLLFILEAPVSVRGGNSYRLAKMVTTAATSEQERYFDSDRVCVFGALNSDGSIEQITPSAPTPTSELPVVPATIQNDGMPEFVHKAQQAMNRAAENIRQESEVSGLPPLVWPSDRRVSDHRAD